jgi:glutathione S-transferase
MRTLLHLPLCPYSRKIRLALAEKHLPFETRIEKVWERRSEFLELNPAGQVPVLLEDNGLAIPDSSVIGEYLDEAYPDMPLYGTTLAERVEVRRLLAWFDGRFGADVTRNLSGEKYYKRISGQGQTNASALRAGYANLREHLRYLGWLAENRNWLAGESISMADLAAAAHLSVLDFQGDVDWTLSPATREWYARVKSRPSFRPLLADRIAGFAPPEHYADLDF